jgi:DNA-binding response OmpR family regulator
MISVEPDNNPVNDQINYSSDRVRKILLVEDDDDLANVYMARLKAEGFDVRRAANGEEALSVALDYSPELVILDVMMPKINGFDVLDILRNTPQTANLKIIMLSALSRDSDQARAKSLQVDEYLIKSQVVIADVIGRVKHHLNMD